MLTASLSIENLVDSIIQEQKALQETQEVTLLPDEATNQSTVSVSRDEATRLLTTVRLQAMHLHNRCRTWRLEVEKVARATRSDISDSDERLARIARVMDDEADRMNTQLVFMKLSYFRTALSEAWKPYKKEFEDIGAEAIRACAEIRNVHRNMARAIRMHINHSPVEYSLNISANEIADCLKKSDAFFSSMGV
ncbi:hypothetical protein DPU24_26610 [Salmonella enterica subsp. enterica serovar Oranienburg]|nr:hypothetical protein [Salmonella enterica subsp. enterica serovar Oranienburg]